ncbi:MAG: hypothetical protein QP807_09645 [Staphylococcus epidermidis]|uniref:hypothetical protein n=2 Tax=Staphylococcus TaxID=1279 RepID=UPI00026BF586|nr:hypothetical protein [Staphylococcus epidermidis]MDU7272088.1 hypothetical protein [Staphylococcus lugdunensis]EJE12434.1 hypothetical protein HMPREF9979_11763 [Staphylococcus epidermidis NIHLM018]MDK7943787.1 hypothetical protein [Staphylococcus epidermidis]MDK8321892.1 hypothetical protein [Staphylococcus epidermidis]MDS3961654.1 hypothetical protein [Staphylococcus epidermidis]
MAFFKIFTIDESVTEWDSVTQTQKNNLNDLFNDFMKDSLNRKYYIDTDKEPEHILSEINTMDKNSKNLNDISNKFARKLLEEELIEDKGKNKRRNKTIKNGILIFKVTKKTLTLMKLEEINTIDKNDFSKKPTYGAEKNYFKIAVMDFQKESTKRLDIDIYDTGTKIAKYWSEGFLSIYPLRDNELNTNDIINSLKENTLFNELPNITEKDLNQSTNDFLSDNREFSFVKLRDHINQRFETDFKNDELFKDDKLNHIDAEFNLEPRIVGKYLQKKIKINDVISLDINNISKATKGGLMKVSNDKRYLKIRLETNIKEDLPDIQEGD